MIVFHGYEVGTVGIWGMHDIESHYRGMIVRFGPFFLMNGQENHIIIFENNAS